MSDCRDQRFVPTRAMQRAVALGLLASVGLTRSDVLRIVARTERWVAEGSSWKRRVDSLEAA